MCQLRFDLSFDGTRQLAFGFLVSQPGRRVPAAGIRRTIIHPLYCFHPTRATMSSMRRFVLVAGVVFLLSGCGTSTTSGTSVVCDQQFWNGTVAACLPAGWRVLSKETLGTLGVPEETVAAFQLQTPHAGQLDTVTVTGEPLSREMTTTEYSQANILAVSTLPDYKLIDKIVTYIDGVESAIHVFSARPSSEQPVRRYYQLSAVSAKTGYTFTGSFPLSIQDAEANEVSFILRNVSFANPAEKAAQK